MLSVYIAEAYYTIRIYRQTVRLIIIIYLCAMPDGPEAVILIFQMPLFIHAHFRQT